MLAAARKSKNREEKRLAGDITRLFSNADRIFKLEQSLQIPRPKRFLGLFLTRRRDILETIEATGRLPRKGESTFVMQNFWNAVKDLKKLSDSRLEFLGRLKRQRKALAKAKRQKTPPRARRRFK